MKNLIMLLAVTFSFGIVNAQETTSTKTKTEMKKSCSKDCTKSCCKNKAKTCTKSKAECDKAKAEGKTGDKSKKSCCANKSEAKKSCASSKKSSSKTCTGGSTAAYSKSINAKEFMAYADRFPAEQIIDIRTMQEVKASGMIDGATNIDYNSRDFKEKMNQLDKNAAVMIYCNSGKRSTEAITLLKSWGFNKIYEMDGGYKAYLVAFPAK